jgi:SPX domain protein involved in polyphosphate accumulation
MGDGASAQLQHRQLHGFSTFLFGRLFSTQQTGHSELTVGGLPKIIKKYDKCTGKLLRLPFIREMLKQPFFTTELMSRLVREFKVTMESTFTS